MHTDVGQLVGTLQYMSPEQYDADPLGLDMRSDVYALGVSPGNAAYSALAPKMSCSVEASAGAVPAGVGFADRGPTHNA